ncbi:MAG: primosomal protein N' [Candidatus Eremiobacteraeota bacterium]|nr:primosomal protein N' [Candidatus Eremiobacteraeota bacterium]
MSNIKPEKEFGLYAQVLVDVHSRKLDKPFTYGLDENQAHKIYVGAVVTVPLKKRSVRGYVVDLNEFPPPLPKGVVIKPVESVAEADSLWDREMIDLARWMEHYYGCTFLDALKVMIPAPVRAKKGGGIPPEPRVKMVVFKNAPDEWEKFERRAPGQTIALKYLMEREKPVKLSSAVKESEISHSVFRALEKKGLVEIFEGSPSFRYFHEFPAGTMGAFKLSEDQKKVYDILIEKYKSPDVEVVLLHGITGSGKTEVYLHLIQKALEDGKEALVLVPEISLTPQAIERFCGRFGEEIAILHSRLTGVQRRQMWWKIRHKEVRVVLGARSAVFAPLENIGIIVVDEEHDSSYKQEREPRYNARQVAIKRAMHHKALVILGSATPSMESYYFAMENKYTFLDLPRRIGGSVLPEIETVNLKNDFKEKRGRIIGDTLMGEMLEVLSRGEQLMLFINRRGFSAFLLCHECGNVVRCPYCDISLTYHKDGHTMKCHYCDYHRPAPSICPFCRGHMLSTPAPGIQKVEEELREYFPGISYIRMDRDTTKGKDSHHQILSSFAGRKAQILIGTQMIAKGHDFPGVTLVGVVLADVSLYLPDFRSLERTYQVLTQVAGRAGRREAKGKVIIQTYNPETPVILAVARQDYKEFYDWESANRCALNYPPFSHIINLLFTGKNESKLREYAIIFSDLLRNKKFKDLFIAVLGPAPCPLSRIKSKYRWHVTLKGKRVVKMVAVIKAIIAKFPIPPDMSFSVDVDPTSLM